MTALEAEKDRSDNKYAAARAIGKWLAKLPKDDAVQVMQHVGIEYGLTVTPAPADKITPPGTAK